MLPVPKGHFPKLKLKAYCGVQLCYLQLQPRNSISYSYVISSYWSSPVQFVLGHKFECVLPMVLLLLPPIKGLVCLRTSLLLLAFLVNSSSISLLSMCQHYIWRRPSVCIRLPPLFLLAVCCKPQPCPIVSFLASGCALLCAWWGTIPVPVPFRLTGLPCTSRTSHQWHLHASSEAAPSTGIGLASLSNGTYFGLIPAAAALALQEGCSRGSRTDVVNSTCAGHHAQCSGLSISAPILVRWIAAQIRFVSFVSASRMIVSGLWNQCLALAESCR